MKRQFSRSPSIIPGLAKDNIDTIMQIEQAFLRDRSGADRLGEVISRFAGSISFVVANIVVFVGWIVVNTGFVHGVQPMDPFPFSFLALVIGVEAIFLSTFVLMAQKRQAREVDHWAHLNLQIGLLGEQETTKVLQMLKLVCDRLGLDKVTSDVELKEMVGKTSVGVLAQELAQNLEKTRDSKEPTDLDSAHG
jgi:uncharacterized membrane protein